MDIFSDVSVSYLDAILGTELQVPTVDGTDSINVPAGTQPGTTIRLANKGAPKLNNLNQRGSHFVNVKVDIPHSLSDKEKDLITQLKSIS